MSEKESKGELIKENVGEFFGIFIPGHPFMTSILNFRDDLKRKRIQLFLEELTIALARATDKTEDEILSLCTTEDFIDIFESTIIKVHQTKSLEKSKRFSNLLVNQIIDPQPDYYILKIIDIIHTLNDVQVFMLQKLSIRSFNKDGNTSWHMYYGYFGKSDKNDNNLILIDLTPTVSVKVHKDELQLYLNDLVSLGLVDRKLETKLKHPRESRPNEKFSLDEKETYSISNSGKSFLELLIMKDD